MQQEYEWSLQFAKDYLATFYETNQFGIIIIVLLYSDDDWAK